MPIVSRSLLWLSVAAALLASGCAGETREQRAVEGGAGTGAGVGVATGVSILGGAAVGAAGGAVGDYVVDQTR